ncbi:MAG TPA: YqaA family protein [Burkholderiales bacterium]|nr:YqaA family protein [Burkholderiales bacterium]
MSEAASLATLFASSFLAATLLPGGSEVVLLAVLATESASRGAAIGVATVGNTLGALTSYAIGRLLPPSIDSRALARLQKYGTPVLLLSWLPLVGDALCVAAGWLRSNIWSSIVFIAAGKFLRYVAVAMLV